MPLTAPTVYIPTLSGGDQLAACLRALDLQTVPAEVVVADNGPGEGCSALLATEFPNVERISFGGRNLGFGAALNRAIASTGAGPVILLNDDTVPEPHFVESLLAVWNQGEVGMVAGVLLKVEDPGLIDSAGVACDQTLTAWDYLSGEPVARLAQAPDPIGPMGGAGLYDRAAFNAVGGFDEGLFLYYEDLDLAFRLNLAGYECRLARRARAIHLGSATVGKGSRSMAKLTGFGRGYMLRKYGILKHPSLAARSVIGDTSAALAHLVLDHNSAAVRGKAEGWKAARHTTQLEPPLEKLDKASFYRQTMTRVRRRQG